MTPKEYQLLELFLRNNGHVLSRHQIIEHLWSSIDPPGQDTVKVHIQGKNREIG
ncbi:winged helix-turn-helix domain-containing protein [Fischerella thermalis]|uniref:Transcriptional regulator domain-containing protein n=1 Tax=Fischerella thermalis JSC-11 TaxID=741277 RepID=G6FY69_9CYAN|nr:winged helix-turn-helix domain-containing protein [Fischerella thermalis]PLZ83206.1 winged helix family transcriptional regulator [Fischerella thermalis WC217]EHC09646.1 transcriptional regulator domain-containing protein [Fischerella thermalis JSC-11]PLZ06988.1 winged helix family transcriptional regulator [Fischerella thermalis WC119]PLZ08839.1 winged helix family transcriptional regulator [Fischerella thermalis WC114]PLZ12972.1 winged helix family transcriptional regulator [Fischerella t